MQEKLGWGIGMREGRNVQKRQVFSKLSEKMIEIFEMVEKMVLGINFIYGFIERFFIYYKYILYNLCF